MNGYFGVKVKVPGKTRSQWLTPLGGTTTLRIHAALFNSLDSARDAAKELTELNPGYVFKGSAF